MLNPIGKACAGPTRAPVLCACCHELGSLFIVGGAALFSDSSHPQRYRFRTWASLRPVQVDVAALLTWSCSWSPCSPSPIHRRHIHDRHIDVVLLALCVGLTSRMPLVWVSIHHAHCTSSSPRNVSANLELAIQRQRCCCHLHREGSLPRVWSGSQASIGLFGHTGSVRGVITYMSAGTCCVLRVTTRDMYGAGIGGFTAQSSWSCLCVHRSIPPVVRSTS